MSEENVLIRGRLATYKKDFERLDLSADSDITTIRNYLDPYEPDVTKIKVDEAKVTMDRLQETIVKMRKLNVQMTELEEALK